MSHSFFIIMSISLIVISIASQILLGILYQNMIDETDNMTTTENKLLKQCKLKFIHCYRLNGGVSNVQIFADKFINRMKVGKWNALTIEHLSGQLVLLSVFASGVGIYFGITSGERVFALLPFYIISLFGLYLFFSVSSAVDLAGKKRILKTNIVDYLENHMISHLEKVPEAVQELEEKEQGVIALMSGIKEKELETMDFMSGIKEKESGAMDFISEVGEIKGQRTLATGSRKNAKLRANGKMDYSEKKLEEYQKYETEDSEIYDKNLEDKLEEENYHKKKQWKDAMQENITEEELQALLAEFLTSSSY